MLTSAPGPKSPSASISEAAPDGGLRRGIIVSAALVLTLAFATTIATTILVANNNLRSTGDDLQARATALARTIDQRLRTYTSALDTIAESHSLLEEFDLSIVEWEARRVGDLFGGWFVLARAGDVMDILMATANPEGNSHRRSRGQAIPRWYEPKQKASGRASRSCPTPSGAGR